MEYNNINAWETYYINEKDIENLMNIEKPPIRNSFLLNYNYKFT